MLEGIVIDSPEKFKEESLRFLKPSETLTVIERLHGLKDLYHRFLLDTSISAEVIGKADSIWDNIISSLEYHQIGLIGKALDTLYNGAFMIHNDIYSHRIQDVTLYRMRYDETGDVFSPEEMFHVPTSKRHLLHNERFSVSGMPVLYLAGCAYTCWEELGRKNFDNCNLSVFYPTRELTLFYLEPIWMDYEEEYILTYPLSTACFLEVYHQDGEYKEEYVIPQLVMQCVLRYNSEHKDIIDGVFYSSSRVLRDNAILADDDIDNRMYNLAFPAVPEYDKKGFSIVLKKTFYVTPPETFGRLRLFNPNPEVGKTFKQYNKSAFGILENKCRSITPTILA